MNRISTLGQIKIYVGKCFRLFLNEKQWTNFISTTLIMLLISIVTSDDMFADYSPTKTGCFAIICACIWIGIFNSIQSVVRERAIIKREHKTGLKIFSYVMAHALYEFILCVVETLIVLAITYFNNKTNLDTLESLITPFLLLDMYITLLLITYASDLIAMMISCIVKLESTAMMVMPFILIIQLIMAGVIFPLEGLSEKISYVTISKWGMNGLISLANTNETVKMGYEIAGHTGGDPEAVNLLMIWLVLLGFSVLYSAISIGSLSLIDKDSR
ncbi:MAG: ABC transporter permease [Erysipelotrichaceae bacterium]|nr:ABC transporter permease [Erysipelotrichaceae bacterium]